MIKKCLYCEKEFEAKRDWAKFCSHNCSSGYHYRILHPVKIKQCLYCGNKFSTCYEKMVCCCRKCNTYYRKEVFTKECLYCKNDFKTTNHLKKYCSKQCCQKYYDKSIFPLLSKTLEKRYNGIIIASKVRNYSFNISLEDYKNLYYQKKCYYCGEETKDGIDRVDNKIGYEISNCVPCCTDCNKMKLAMTQEKFIDKCIKVSQIHSHNTSKLINTP